MKKFLALSLAAIFLSAWLTGCHLSGSQPTTQAPATEAPTTVPPTTAAPETEPPTEPTEPLSTSFPYLQAIPGEACIFKSPDPSSAFVQTIGADGTFTIVAEERSADGDRWGKLKSGLGWVNLTDFFCGGPQVPAVTGSFTGKIVSQGDCIRAYCNTSSDIYCTFTFMPHEPVTDITFRQEFPTANTQNTLYTLSALGTEKPLVITGTFVEFDYFVFSYTDQSGQRHSITIGTSNVEAVTYFNHN